MKPFLRILFHLALPVLLIAAGSLIWSVFGRYGDLVMVGLCCGVVILLGFAYASGFLRAIAWRSHEGLSTMADVAPAHGWPGWLLVAAWALAWAWVWAALPSGHLLKLLTPVVFFALAWHSLGEEIAVARPVQRILGWVVLLTLLVLLFWAVFGWKGARIPRFFMGPLDLGDRDYAYAQIVKAWHSLNMWGAVTLPQAGGARLLSYEMELLKVMVNYGVFIGTVVAVSLLLAWSALWGWVRRIPESKMFSSGARRFTLALVFLHAAAAWAYVLFNMGITRRGFGAGLPPVSTLPSWWLPSAALLVMLGFAARAWWSQRAVGSIAASGKNGWITVLGYVLAGAALGLGLWVVGNLCRAAAWSQMLHGY